MTEDDQFLDINLNGILSKADIDNLKMFCEQCENDEFVSLDVKLINELIELGLVRKEHHIWIATTIGSHIYSELTDYRAL